MSLNGSKELGFVSLRQFSFLTGPTKLVFVRIAGSTYASLVGPLSLRQCSFLTDLNKLVFVRLVLLLV